MASVTMGLEADAPLPGDRSFLGHPKGLAFLAFTEAWERFSFYGMTALLLLYMIERLLTPGVAPAVLGLAGFRSAVEAVTGPLSNQAFASQLFGLYSGFVYFTPVFGGMLADRVLGQRRTVMLGAVLMSAGHLLMALDTTFLLALFLLVLGSGCLKGNISTQVGHLYPVEQESRRTRAYAIYSAGVNLGALSGPIVCGVLAQVYGWHVGFGTAGVLMLFGLATYAAGWRHLPPDRMRVAGATATERLTAAQWRAIGGLCVVSLLGILPTVAYYQEANAGLLFIEQAVDRNFGGWTVPASSFNAWDGLFCILYVTPLVLFWKWQARRGTEPGDLGKIAIGYGITALANLVMLVPAARADAGATVSVGWSLGLYALNALAFLFYWPTQLALFSRAAPPRVNGTMMGVLFCSVFVGNLLVGTIGGLWEKISHAHFFLLHVALGAIPALLMLLLSRPLRRVLEPRDVHSAKVPGDLGNPLRRGPSAH